MSDEHGIKELSEASMAMMKLSAIIARHLKDGAQISDIAAIVGEAMNDQSIKDGMDGVSKIPAEAGDLSMEEGLALAAMLIPSIGELIGALTGKE